MTSHREREGVCVWVGGEGAFPFSSAQTDREAQTKRENKRAGERLKEVNKAGDILVLCFLPKPHSEIHLFLDNITLATAMFYNECG